MDGRESRYPGAQLELGSYGASGTLGSFATDSIGGVSDLTDASAADVDAGDGIDEGWICPCFSANDLAALPAALAAVALSENGASAVFESLNECCSLSAQALPRMYVAVWCSARQVASRQLFSWAGIGNRCSPGLWNPVCLLRAAWPTCTRLPF